MNNNDPFGIKTMLEKEPGLELPKERTRNVSAAICINANSGEITEQRANQKETDK